MNKEDLLNKLRSGGHRITRQREVVLDALLLNTRRMLSASDVMGAVPEGDCIDLATVYRSLEYFLEAGIAEVIIDDNGVSRYTISSGGHHHHLICSECGALIDMPCPEGLFEEFCARKGFTVKRHKLEIYGICSSCRKD